MVSNSFNRFSKLVCGGKVWKLSKYFLATVTIFFVVGTNGLCKIHGFSVADQKELPATVPKPWFFCCRKKRVFQNHDGFIISGKIVAGAMIFVVLIAGAK